MLIAAKVSKYSVTMGKRNQARIRDLLRRLKGIEIDFFSEKIQKTKNNWFDLLKK
jgi:hypothetical protein